ncbi:protein-L-isoaspartate(D-aspartate) O-methyltransferase [Sediminitomix flava]|nr:protein-L-isoaspartate(D-aspartate) O-methyltransferase [Sediminitomix flava]
MIKMLQRKGISNHQVLESMGRIPRHLFMDSAFLEHAYQDKPFSIGHGQTISSPYTVATQSSLLELQKGDKVLEIGTGSGYQASVLADMGAQVTSIEYLQSLHVRANNLLKKLGYKVDCIHGDGSLGYPVKGPYDKIIVTAGAPFVPNKLLSQLKTGGILVIPIGDSSSQIMTRYHRISENEFKKETFELFSFVKLRGEQGWDSLN